MGDLPDLANHYRERLNRALDYITRHLDQPLDLEAVAKVAAFSPFHFHRVFRSMMGETLLQFVKRTRLERALYLMSHAPTRSLTDIALEVGFNSSSDFSRSFKAQFGVSARGFDLERWRREGLARIAPQASSVKVDDHFEVRLRTVPARRVAYLRVFKPFEPGRAKEHAERLVTWAKARGLHHGQWLGFMWEEPELVPPEKCRYDVGLEVPEDVVLGDGVSEQRFEEMLVAELPIAGPIELELRAFEWLYGTWLPSSGYEPAHQPVFEAWNGLPWAHGDSHFELRLHLAVERR